MIRIPRPSSAYGLATKLAKQCTSEVVVLRVFQLHKSLSVLRIERFINIVECEESEVLAGALAFIDIIQDCVCQAGEGCDGARREASYKADRA